MFEHNGVEYYIKPEVLSSRVIEALSDGYRRECRLKFKELFAQRDTLGEELYAELSQPYLRPVVTFQNAVEFLQSIGGMTVALHLCCDQVHTIEDARQLVRDVPNVMTAFKVIAEAMREDMEAAKNFSPPSDPLTAERLSET